jgi:RNA polymerase sporulation-specific sigma factor
VTAVKRDAAMSLKTDEELLANVRSGNTVESARAEETLIRRYNSLVRLVARQYFLLSGGDSDDLIQEGMLGLLTAIRKYDRERGAAFKTFAKLCIRRRIYSAIRKFASPNALELTDGQTDSAANPEELFIDKEKSDEFLSGFMAGLSTLEAKILKRYLSGETYREIASRIGKSTKTVDNAIQRVKRKLEKVVDLGQRN